MAVALVTLALVQEAWAQGTGRSLDIQPGARQNAMGAAGVASLGDPSDAIWWNTAALGFARRPDMQLTVAQVAPGLATDAGFAHLAIACPVAWIAGIGLGYTELNYPQSYGYADADEYRGYNGYGDHEQAFSASIGAKVLPNLSIGATAKWIQIKFLSLSGETWGYDGGALYRVLIDSLSVGFGVNVQNVGPQFALPYGVLRSPLTRNLRAGTAIEYVARLAAYGEIGVGAVFDHSWTLLEQSNYATWNSGLEIYGGVRGLARLSLWGGYYDDPTEQIRGATYGAGLRLAVVSVEVGSIPQGGDGYAKPITKVTVGLHFVPLPRR